MGKAVQDGGADSAGQFIFLLRLPIDPVCLVTACCQCQLLQLR